MSSLLVLSAILLVVNAGLLGGNSKTAQQTVPQNNPTANSRLGRTLESLYHKGRKMANDMKPELENIGKDAKMVYGKTKQDVINPLAKQVKPQINNVINKVKPTKGQPTPSAPQEVGPVHPPHANGQFNQPQNGVWSDQAHNTPSQLGN